MKMMESTEIVWHLEMLSRDAFRPAREERNDLAWVPVPFPMPELNRFFYVTVGNPWFWLERLPWSYRQWLDYLDRPELQTFLVTQNGVPAGYCELEKQKSGQEMEIVYFGILPQFIGKGIGKWALSQAIDYAWNGNISRLWVHTCNKDSPVALKHYLARGFGIFKTEEKLESLPEQPPPLWEGA